MSTTESRPAVRAAGASDWSLERSAELYRVESWGGGYFAINDQGHVVVQPDKTADRAVDLLDVVAGLEARGLTTPVLLRFSDILAHRLQEIHDAFERAISENDYRGEYRAVYPIKVNQQRHVVEEVFHYGARHGFGLEVGSKPELLAVLGLTVATPDRPIICNGFKDTKYIETVILAHKLGRTIIPVVEGFNELHYILHHARRYGVRPRIGVRVKLAAQGVGRWRDSAGAKSKFGLFVTELLELLEILKQHEMTDCLQLLHCHVGSQIHDIRNIKNALAELAHVYVELVRLGAGLKYLDVGGGLAVDYFGTRANVESSMNYSLNEYASDVIYRVASVCNEAGVEHPTIITECGRAMVAHQSVLVFNAMGSTQLDRFVVPADLKDELADAEDPVPQPIADLFDAYHHATADRLVECYHDAVIAREEAMNLFKVGYLSLPMRGLAERLFWATCARIRDVTRTQGAAPAELADLEVILSDIYFCNFSVFQSLPDSWAVGQLFPVMPLHRLDEPPVRRAVLADMTCDSDGKIDRFVTRTEPKRTLELHDLRPGEPYFLGVFLVGAYQEILGDLHNLFGDTHAVHVRVEDDGSWWIDEVVEGDSVREVLSYVQYDVDRLRRQMRRDCEQAVHRKQLSVAESQELLAFYDAGLAGYTYLETE